MTEDILISVRGLHTLDIEQEEEEIHEKLSWVYQREI